MEGLGPEGRKEGRRLFHTIREPMLCACLFFLTLATFPRPISKAWCTFWMTPRSVRSNARTSALPTCLVMVYGGGAAYMCV